MHRVRAVLPHLAEFGWQPEVIAVDSNCIHIPQDAWLEAGVPREIAVHRAGGLGKAWSRLPGLGSIETRALSSIRKVGNQVFKSGHFDLVYFSTTSFGIHVLGPYWEKRFGVPFAMDYQDPWVNDYYQEHPEVVPPGGRFKYAIVDQLSRYREPRVLRSCSGITSVSPMYPEQLKRRYPWLLNLPCKVLPFPGVNRDFERVKGESIEQFFYNPNDGLRHWVYVGRGGEDMAFALSGFFEGLRQWRDTSPAAYAKTRLHFIGTSYAPAGKGKATILPIAKEYGVDDVVNENTDRIQYSQMLRCLIDAHALIVPGSNDPAYTASKLYPYLLARKPVLAIFNRASSVVEVISKVGGAALTTFDSQTAIGSLAESIYQTWFSDNSFDKIQPLDREAFEPYTDRGSARLLCDFFDSLIATRT
jgi:hypothetical protein